MRKLNFVIVIVALVLLQFGCSRDSSNLNLQAMSALIKKTNLELPSHNRLKSDIINGSITHKLIKGNEFMFHQFKLIGENGKNILFEFQLKENSKPKTIPETITNAIVIMFAEQLIVQDLSNDEVYSFLISSFPPKVSLKQTMPGVGLAIKFFGSPEQLAGGGGCDCSCKKCFQCNYDCGTRSRTCECNGISNSITCDACYNAECSTSNCEDEDI